MIVRIAIACSVLCGLLGCASRNTIQIQSFDTNHRFAQQFTHAYSTRSDDGTYDIVLVQEPTEPREKPGAPLKPVAGMAQRQVVHLRILWRPLIVGRADAPTTAANATIDWFVFSETGSRQTSMLHYRGGGLVEVTGSDAAPRIRIRSATMKPVAASGNLEDPIGQSLFTGRVAARRDPAAVQNLLDDLKSSATASVQP